MVWKNRSSVQGTEDWSTILITVGKSGKEDVKRQRDRRNEYLAWLKPKKLPKGGVSSSARLEGGVGSSTLLMRLDLRDVAP